MDGKGGDFADYNFLLSFRRLKHVDFAYNIHGYKGQPVLEDTRLKPQSSLYYKSTTGYKGHPLLGPLKASPDMANLSEVHYNSNLYNKANKSYVKYLIQVH